MRRTLVKNGTLWFLLLLLSVVASLLLFEVVYRYQLIDTFSGELRSFNPPEVLEPDTSGDGMLIMGDSFTANHSSYASVLRVCQDHYPILNAGVSGTGIIEALFTAPRRFQLAKPKVFIYQVFVGNDLYNIRYPINWQDLSLVRNLYWLIAQQLRSVWYLNYRNAQIAYLLSQSDTADVGSNAITSGAGGSLGPLFGQAQPVEKFSKGKYTLRDQLMLEADPWILDKQILVRGDRGADYRFFLDKLRELLSFCKPEECQGYLLVIPHQAQVDKHYLENMEALGAKFSATEEILSVDYPFLTRLRDFLVHNHLENIELLNPLPALRQSERQGRVVYYQNDSHLNHQGNRVLASFLLDELGLEPACDVLD